MHVLLRTYMYLQDTAYVLRLSHDLACRCFGAALGNVNRVFKDFVRISLKDFKDVCLY